MEALAMRCGRKGERAFVTGLVSLFDRALGLSLAEIVERLALDDEIRAALCGREGEIGRLLVLADAMERGDDSAVAQALERLPALRGEDLAEASQQALRWATALGEPG
jgi:EAL and modified HD-GYP domain-containing signal transduction protein